ncbi:MAG: hypoxanthine phosphoribosyltransferase [Bacteroidales bacterium]|nr:hypoxanthine phosphoribosyltransferase [Bacteroidales bacterium]
MEKVRLHDKNFRLFIRNEQIMKAIDEVAEKINADFKDCTDVPVLLCVLNGSILFTAELMKRIDFNIQLVSTKLSSYSGTSTTGEVRQTMGLTADVKGRRIIIVEDIVDTGHTIVDLEKILKERGASETMVCTMLYKPESYKMDVPLKYVAMEIPNDFIVGFGLDYDELGRNLNDIYILDQE